MNLRRFGIRTKFKDYWNGGLGFDLGTANTLVYARGKGIVVNQPSYVAFRDVERTRPREVLAIGAEAKEMLGRAPKGVDVVAPIDDGMIGNFAVAKLMLNQLVKRSYGDDHFFRTYCVMCVPSGSNEIERKAFQEIADLSKLGRVYFLEEVMAGALGAGINVRDSRGSMVIDIGGGTTDVAVISLGGIVTGQSIRVAGNSLDKRIADYVKHEHNLHIGAQSAEKIKIAVGTTKPNGKQSASVRGSDLKNGLPKEALITEQEVYDAIKAPVQEIIGLCKRVLALTPPELASDIYESGLTMVGGGALLRGLDRTISEEMGIPVSVAEDPLTCTAYGLGKIIQEGNGYRKLLSEPDSTAEL